MTPSLLRAYRTALILLGLWLGTIVPGGLPVSGAFAADSPIACLSRTLEDQLRYAAPRQTYVTTDALARFAQEHGLPTATLQMGPPERPIERLFVALDHTRPELVEAYLKQFALEHSVGADHAGTLVLEFGYEVPGSYVSGVLRPSPDNQSKIYRWGKPDPYLANREVWWKDWVLSRSTSSPIKGYAHLIGLSPSELANVKHFLENPQERGRCKADNCVAWTASIELGRTAADATDAERKYLFSELGMARSMAHFEIGRRLMNAANERHAAVVVFVEGEAGYQAFKQDLRKYLPGDPQIPYESVIRGLRFAEDSEVMKAVAQIPDGGKVFIPIAAGASPEAVQALLQRAPTVEKGYDVHVLVNGVSEAMLRKGLDAAGSKFRLHALFLGGNLRKLYREGKATVIPGYLGDFNRMVRDPSNLDFHYDSIVVRVSPKDERGRYSLGPNNDMIMGILRDRPGIRVIAEVNPNVPRTMGDNYLTDEMIAARFESKAQLAGPPRVPLTEVEERIGKYLASLVPNDAYLQIGIGNIFDGLPPAMQSMGTQRIKILTEMFGDPLMDLMKNGNAKQAETGFAYGSPDLYAWLNNNRKVRFVETEKVNNPGRVARLSKFHAINTALQVDMMGNVNATIGPDGKRMSSPGGQVEFMFGAARSPEGKAIIAIRSTAKGGKLSTIVLNLYTGPVTTPHESVTHVVTEYGIAELKGRNESERALALIRISHPKFRKVLIHQALTRGLISAEQASKLKAELFEGGGQ